MKKRMYNKYDSGKAFTFALFLPEILVLVYAIVVSIIASAFKINYEQLIKEYWFLAISVVLSPLAYFLVFNHVSKKSNVNVKVATGISFKLKTKNVILCILISVICILGINWFVDIFDGLVKLTGFKGSYELPFPIDTVGWLVFYLFCVALLPAIFEEIVFRGIVFNGLKEYGTKKAIIFSAALFMLIHGGIEQTVYPFLLGIILALVMHKTGNIIYPIIVHFMNNALVIIMNFVIVKTNVIWELPGDWWFIVLSILAAALTMYVIIAFICPALKGKDVVIEKEELNKLLDEAPNNEVIVEEKQYDNPNTLLKVGVICAIILWVIDLISGFGLL